MTAKSSPRWSGRSPVEPARSTAPSSIGAAELIQGPKLIPAMPFGSLPGCSRAGNGRGRTPIGRTRRPARCISTRSKRSGRRSRNRTTGSRSRTRLERCGGWAKQWNRMHREAKENSEPAAKASEGTVLVSEDPSTGAELWSGEVGDAAAEVAAARAAFPAWAAHSNAYRIEALRRFANVVRRHEAEFAELIARETGKPLWETRTEVAAVVNKVDISVEAYAERTPQRKMEAALGNRIAVRHKPHGVLAVLGPYNFPAHLPNGHIVPALIAGNAIVFKPSEKTPATGQFLVGCFHEAGVPEGVLRLLIGGPDQGRALAAQPGIDGLLFTGSARAGLSLHKQFAETPQKILALELGGNNPLVIWGAKDIEAAATL